MAKLQLNALLAALRGTIGDLVLVREGDNIYVRQRARKVPPRTEKQQSHNSRFALASRWARMLLSDPEMKAAYERARTGHLTAHNVAICDFMHAPAIQSIDLVSYTGKPGDAIRILATDNFRVARVLVQVRSVAGQVLEQGEAEWNAIESVWRYTAQTQVPPETTLLIEATALDLPGNRAAAQICHYVAR